jgi:hypothetical protein
MSKISSLTLVLPGLLEQLPRDPANDSLLARVCGRGDVAHRWHANSPDEARLKPWQRGMLATMGLEPSAYPSAAVCALAEGLASRHWLHAEPIHLAAGLNEVTFVPLRPAWGLTHEEIQEATGTLRPHLAAEGFELVPISGGWLVGASEDFDAATVESRFAACHDWKTVLPQGAGAGRLRRLMTELQMLLHDHRVNQSRAARGLPIVNALWFWGNGTLNHKTNGTKVKGIGSNSYLRGVCAANGWECVAGDAATVDAVLRASEGGDPAVCVIEGMSPEVFERDWLPGLLGALTSERISRLDLVLDEWFVAIDRWRWRRFWRRPRTLAGAVV